MFLIFVDVFLFFRAQGKYCKLKASNFGSLPDNVLHKIIEHLPVSNAFSLRLTCYHFSEISKCKELFEKVQMHISRVEKHDK